MQKDNKKKENCHTGNIGSFNTKIILGAKIT